MKLVFAIIIGGLLDILMIGAGVWLIYISTPTSMSYFQWFEAGIGLKLLLVTSVTTT